LKVKVTGFTINKKNKSDKNLKQKNFIFCGNANTGKSTVFNSIAGANAHVGNWLGVTVNVESKRKIKNGIQTNYFDLPGTASLVPTSDDEQNAVNFLKENSSFTVINVCDLNNLKRNLYLTLELLENGYKVCLLLNFKKSFYKSKGKINLEKLSKILNIPVILFNGKKTELVEGNAVHMSRCADAYARHKRVEQILQECDYVTPHFSYGTNKIDKFLLNKFFAVPCFFATMVLIFLLTFVIVPKIFDVPLNMLFNLLEKVSSWSFYRDVILESLKVILTFVPQIVTILLCINILENSGYISRLAFTFEDVFEKFGLNGKSIFPILMSLGCATVATPFTKGISDKNTQFKTASILSLFPCSAKLPILVLLLSTITSGFTAFYICLAYIFCIVIALIFALILNRKYKSEPSNLILEFPSLKIVSFKQILKNICESLKSLTSRILFVIFVVNIILFCLNKFNVISILTIIPLMLLSIFGFGGDAVTALVSGIVGKELIATGLTGINLTSVFTTQTILLFLIFAMFYTPCFSTTGLLVEQFGIKKISKLLVLQFVFAYILTCLFGLILMPRNFLKFVIALSIVISIYLIIKVLLGILTKKISYKNKCNKKLCSKCKQNCCKNV